MSDNPKISALFKLTPKEAVAYLQGRSQLTPTFNWQDLWQDEHAQQFTVSRLARLDIMESLRDGITASVAGDLSRRDWTKNARELLQKEGWWGVKQVVGPISGEMLTTKFNPARLKLIYDTNTRMAYAAGQWQRIAANRATHPYVRYITKRDEKVRHQHRAWDNLTLPVDHPFWKTHFPPNGWRCRCRAVSLSRAEYDKGLSPNGQALNKTAPEIKLRDWVNKRTGEVTRVPQGIDPGFAYNPGMAQARGANMMNVALAKMQTAMPVPAAQTMREILSQPVSMAALAADFKSWAESIEQPRGELRHVGVMLPKVVAGLEARNIQPASAVLSVRDTDVLHTHRPSKGADGKKLPWDWYLDLPRHLMNYRAVLLDKTESRPVLLMVFDAPGEKTAKLVVKLDYEMAIRDAEGVKQTVKLNIIRSGRVESVAGLKGFEVLDGAL